MITIEKIDDAGLIENHLRKNTGLNLYQIGDLDEFFRPYTEWYGTRKNGELIQVVLIYKGTELPVLLALCDRDTEDMKVLLKGIRDELPDRIYSHLSKGLYPALSGSHEGIKQGNYLKMIINREDFIFDKKKIAMDERETMRRMTGDDLEEIKKLYEESYPGNWFDERMLMTGKYFGYFISGELKGISGIHVYSPEYRIAVLGNITTHPSGRNRSICKKVTTALCEDLFETVDVIGLNVHEDNRSAIRSYESIGFSITDEYEEYMFERRS